MHGALPGPRDFSGLSKLPTSGLSLPRLKFRINSIIFYLIAAIVLFATYIRHSSHDKHDPFKCHALLKKGKWLDPASSGRSKPPFQKWQPDGCMLRGYNAKSITECLEANRGHDAVFIGDSTVREVFWAMARKLDATAAAKEKAQVKDKHADIIFKHEETILEFVWDPFINSSRLSHHVMASRLNAADPRRVELPNSKALVVVGGGLWYARIENGATEYKAALDKAAAPTSSEVHADVLRNPGANRVYFLPVQPPYYARLDKEHALSLQRDAVTEMNRFVDDLPILYEVDVLLSYLEMIRGKPDTYQPNGLHVTSAVADVQAEVILNARCNNGHQSYPYVGSCCYDYKTNFTQSALILFGVAALLVMVAIELKIRYYQSSIDEKFEPIKKNMHLLRPLLVMWAALVYCWVCDRTHLFNKIGKQYNNLDFAIFCIAIALAGGLSFQRSAPPNRANQEKPANVDQPFLSRDQTDEWKGWMQLLILAYHYTGASKILWIYRIIRLLVASYLFMTGYGHAAYFYQKGDFSLKRVVAVNLRLNLLSCLLPWMMDSDYLFYYFAPLVTYWYVVIYVTMRIKSNWNEQLPLFLAKVGAAAAITSILHTQPAVFAPLFSMVNFVFGAKWDAREWLFRCALDQYIVYVGMVVAVLYVRSAQPPPPPAPPQDAVAATSHTQPGFFAAVSRPTRTQLYVADAVALVVYTLASSSQTTKPGSNAVHTYVSPLAVLAFVHLRNATPQLRNHYSTAYAWVGRVSLETFVLQYHIWLAGDTKGLLSTGLFGQGGMDVGRWLLQSGMGLGRWTDCILIGVVFVWVSQHVAKATAAITSGTTKLLFG